MCIRDRVTDHDDRQAEDPGSTDPLDQAGGDEQPEASGEVTGGSGEREEDEAGQHDPAPADPVGEVPDRRGQEYSRYRNGGLNQSDSTGIYGERLCKVR